MLTEKPSAIRWHRPLLEAVLISAFVLGFFYYWYAVADRYAVFLYGHVAPGIPSSEPFDRETASRYWMAGLVASGMVMVLYAATHWLLGRLAARRQRRHVPPAWWRVWLPVAAATGIGIPAITMTVNAPTLPLGWALACVAATWLGLAVALQPGQWAATRPVDLAWLAAEGLGLLPALTLLRAVELPGRGLSIAPALLWTVAVGGVVGGIVWLAFVSWVRQWRERRTGSARETPAATTLLLSGLAISYLLMPLVHHLLATPPGFRYITTAGNFFAYSVWLQCLVLLVAAGMALAATRLRFWLDRAR
jgi:hypothetical protein